MNNSVQAFRNGGDERPSDPVQARRNGFPGILPTRPSRPTRPTGGRRRRRTVTKVIENTTVCVRTSTISPTSTICPTSTISPTVTISTVTVSPSIAPTTSAPPVNSVAPTTESVCPTVTRTLVPDVVCSTMVFCDLENSSPECQLANAKDIEEITKRAIRDGAKVLINGQEVTFARNGNGGSNGSNGNASGNGSNGNGNGSSGSGTTNVSNGNGSGNRNAEETVITSIETANGQNNAAKVNGITSKITTVFVAIVAAAYLFI